MILGNDKSNWESANGIFTATEIHQQPATWNKTIAQIKNEKRSDRKIYRQCNKQRRL